jgi:hypothetical protein
MHPMGPAPPRNGQVPIGDLVILRSEGLLLAKFRKFPRHFVPRWLGPFPVLETQGAPNFKLPRTMSRVHPIFHGNVLKRYKAFDHSTFPGGNTPAKQDGNQDEVDGQMFEIESIIDKDVVKVNGKILTKYRVRWKGYRAEDDSWLEYSATDPDWQEDKHLVIAWEQDQAARAVQRVPRPSRERASKRHVKGVQVKHGHQKGGRGSERNWRTSTWVARDKVKGVQVKRCHVEVGSGSERNWRTKPRITGSHNIQGCSRGSPERRTGTGPRDGTIQGGSRGSPERRTGTGPWDGNGYSRGSPERRTGVVQSKSLRRSRGGVKVDSGIGANLTVLSPPGGGTPGLGRNKVG